MNSSGFAQMHKNILHNTAGSELIAMIEKSDFNRSNRSFAATQDSLVSGKQRKPSGLKASIGGWMQSRDSVQPSAIDQNRKKLNNSLGSQPKSSQKPRSRNLSKP